MYGFLLMTLAVLLGASYVACRPVMLEDTWARPSSASIPLDSDPR